MTTQLVAIGAQDVHLVGNPEISFFRSNYKRHTNFSKTLERQVIQGNPSDNGMSTVRFERKGDLLAYVYLTAHDSNNGVQSLDGSQWAAAISKVELLIGGQVIDTQTSEFSSNIAVDTLAQTLSKSAIGENYNPLVVSSYFYPLRFSFFENWQSALPLVALQYHDVEIRITWGDTLNHTYSCMASYMHLDNDERNVLSSKPQNMLIYQVQKAQPSHTKIQELNFNHPVKFIAAGNTTDNFISTTNKVKLQINGSDVEDYNFVIPNFTQAATYYHCPYGSLNADSYFLYPFCLDTSKLQPTGTLNFSRLDSVRIMSESEDINETFYGVNYNILRIENGMGGLMYAN